MSDGARVREILLTVSGSISAYKAAYLARELGRSGARVHVLMTRAATKFVSPLTFEALTGEPAEVEPFRTDDGSSIRHVALAREADVFVVAPATADFLARLALGLANDVPTAAALVCRAPFVIAPAMNTDMWLHPATQEHLATLRSRGATIVEPEFGDLACGEVGPGRLAEVESIVEAVFEAAERGREAHDNAGVESPPASPLSGRKVVVTAGGTEESIDPVRVISNRSSGRMGAALATEALARGAKVTVIAARHQVPMPQGAREVSALSVAEMGRALTEEMVDGDVLLMAAAVSDFVPATSSDKKIKRGDGGLLLQLRSAPDLLAGVGRSRRPGQILVGFALETDDGEAHARSKLAAKGLDLIVLNHPREALGTSSTQVVLVPAEGAARPLAAGPKSAVAGEILDVVEGLITARG